MTDLILVLSRSPEQQAAAEKFVASQYDPLRQLSSVADARGGG